MAKSTLPIIAAGIALLLLGGKKKKASPKPAEAAPYEPSPYEPAPYIPPKTPSKPAAPKEPAAEPEGMTPSQIDRILKDLGYQGNNAQSIGMFQTDWNSLMVWLWKRDPDTYENNPKFKLIKSDGEWGSVTENRAKRALDFVPRGGTAIDVDDKKVHVSSFSDMVRKVTTLK